MYLLIPYILLLGFGNILYKINKQPVLKTMFMVNFWSVLLGAALLGLSFIWTDDPFENLTWTAFGFIVLRSLFGASAFFCFLQAVKRLPVSIVEPVSVAQIFPLLFIGWAVFGDVVTVVAGTLAVVIFVMSVLLGLSAKEKSEQNTPKNYLIGLLWLLGFILLSTGVTTMVRQVGGLGVNVILFVTIHVFIVFALNNIFLLATRQSPLKVLKELHRDKVLMAVTLRDNFWVVFHMPLALMMNIGVLEAILVSSSALTVLLGRVLLKEKIKWHSYVLIAVILVAAVLISL